MPLHVQNFARSLDDLPQAFEYARHDLSPEVRLAFDAPEAALELVGPFPVFTASPGDFLARAPEEAAERTGWRALASISENPQSVVDISFGADGESQYAFRDVKAAAAFAAVLQQAMEYADVETHYDVRWLSLPDVYVSALWLAGSKDVFLPTRLGSPDRPEALALDLNVLRVLIQELYDEARRGGSDKDRSERTWIGRSGLST